MTSTHPLGDKSPMVQLAESRTREGREGEAQRDQAVRIVARLAPDQQDEAVLSSSLGQARSRDGIVRLESALAVYVQQVAVEIDVPAEAVAHEVTDTATAYLGLTARSAEHPHRDLMLVWDERLGWYIGIEPRGNDQPPVICYFGGHIVPTPAAVARFVLDVVAGHRRGELSPVPAQLDRTSLAARMGSHPPHSPRQPSEGV